NEEKKKKNINHKYKTIERKNNKNINKEKKAQEKFIEVKEAYEVLSDDQKRAQYDQFGHAGASGQGFSGFGGQDFSGGFGDIFDMFFGGGGGRQDPNAPRQGADRSEE